MMIKSRAAVAHGAHRPMTIETIEYEEPQGSDVLVKIRATGLCHSDLHILDGSLPFQFPVVLGHEGSGTVVRCGPDAKGFEPGDHVVALFVPECGVCVACTSGKTNLCALRSREEHTRAFWNGQEIKRMSGIGTFAEYSVIRDAALAKVNPKAPFDRSFYAGCGVTTGVGAAVFQAKVETGAKVIVFGLGGIGLNVLQGARLQQASMIIGVDTNPAREEIARKMGATHFVNPKAIDGDLVEHLRVLTGGGADYTFECVGITSLMKQASDAAHPLWGVLTFVGAAPIQDMVCASPFDFLGGRKWQGTLFGGAKGKTDTPKIIDWYLDGKIDIDSLVTHEIALEDINEGFEMMKRGESIRTVITLD
jgi:S-(hydroxymethyl)glutathione dehydrogenase/alcohol dehydrogenase